MRRRRSVSHTILWSAVRAAIKIADRVRTVGPTAALGIAILTLAGAYLSGHVLMRAWGWTSPQRSSILPWLGDVHAAISPLIQANVAPAFTPIDAPGAGAAMFQGTIGISDDAAGDITGTYLDADFVAHGFVRTSAGTISAPFDAPDAGTTSSVGLNGSGNAIQGTIPIGISSSPTISGSYTVVGTYIDANYCFHGFTMNSGGPVTSFDATTVTAGCDSSARRGTRAIAVNSSGVATGTYVPDAYEYHGFKRTPDGTITTFDAPGVGTNGYGTIPLGINANGDIVGTYVDNNSTYHGFLYPASGSIATFDIPGAVGNGWGWSRYSGTIPLAINDSGTIAGTWSDSNSVKHAFVGPSSGPFTSFDVPGAATIVVTDPVGYPLNPFPGTGGFGINSAGDVAGIYMDANSVFHGFVRFANGTIVSYDDPAAGTGAFEGTGAFSINSSEVVAGTYADANLVFHGFAINVAGAGGTPVKAAMISPVPKSVLSGSSVTFTWTNGAGVSAYLLELGTTGVGSQNLFNSGGITATSATVSGLPTNGGTLYARLFSKIAGAWQYTDYTYTEAGTPVKAAMISPVPGSLLSGSSVTFTWSAGGGVSAYLLELGTTGIGSQNLFNSGGITTTSATATDLPTNGATVYARLYSKIAGAWQYTDYIYTAAGAVKAAMVSPAPGSLLSGSNVTFTWSAGTGITAYLLELGTSGVGSQNLFNSGGKIDTSAMVTGLPTNGATVYARLFSKIAGAWQYADYTYTAAGAVKAAMTSPVPGSVLSGANVTFTWDAGSGVTAYLLELGTTGVGSQDLFNSGGKTATSATVTGLPTNGGKVYARLFSKIGGAWQYTDYTYTAF